MPSAEQSSAYRHYLMKAEDLFLTRVTLAISIKRTPSSNAATRQVRHQTRAELLNVRCTTSYPLLLLPDRVYGRVVIPTVLSAPARTRCTTAGIKEVKREPERDVTRKFLLLLLLLVLALLLRMYRWNFWSL